jgi:hypothetical protein
MSECECVFGGITADGWLAVATIGLFLVTALLALFTYRLWTATKKLVLGTDDTARRELRAYISMRFEFLSCAVGQPLEGVIFFDNHGQTPAKELRVEGQIWFAPEPRLANFMIPTLQVGPPRGGLWPRAQISSLQPGPFITAEDVFETKAGRRKLYMHARLEYTDAFDVLRSTEISVECANPFVERPRLSVIESRNEWT